MYNSYFSNKNYLINTIFKKMSDISGSKIALGSSKLERDLGLTVSDDLKWEGHISTIVNMANRLLGLLK